MLAEEQRFHESHPDPSESPFVYALVGGFNPGFKPACTAALCSSGTGVELKSLLSCLLSLLSFCSFSRFVALFSSYLACLFPRNHVLTRLLGRRELKQMKKTQKSRTIATMPVTRPPIARGLHLFCLRSHLLRRVSVWARCATELLWMRSEYGCFSGGVGYKEGRHTLRSRSAPWLSSSESGAHYSRADDEGRSVARTCPGALGEAEFLMLLRLWHQAGLRTLNKQPFSKAAARG